MSRRVKSMETESRLVVLQGSGGDMGKLGRIAKGYGGFFFGVMKCSKIVIICF